MISGVSIRAQKNLFEVELGYEAMPVVLAGEDSRLSNLKANAFSVALSAPLKKNIDVYAGYQSIVIPEHTDRDYGGYFFATYNAKMNLGFAGLKTRTRLGGWANFVFGSKSENYYGFSNEGSSPTLEQKSLKEDASTVLGANIGLYFSLINERSVKLKTVATYTFLKEMNNEYGFSNVSFVGFGLRLSYLKLRTKEYNSDY
jgi:hypothetical protein